MILKKGNSLTTATPLPVDEPSNASISTDEVASKSAGKRKGGRKGSQFVGRDRKVFLAMLLIPATIHIVIVWIPTILSIGLSLTKWNGIRFSDLEWSAFQNYDQIILGPIGFADNACFPPEHGLI